MGFFQLGVAVVAALGLVELVAQSPDFAGLLVAPPRHLVEGSLQSREAARSGAGARRRRRRAFQQSDRALRRRRFGGFDRELRGVVLVGRLKGLALQLRAEAGDV